MSESFEELAQKCAERGHHYHKVLIWCSYVSFAIAGIQIWAIDLGVHNIIQGKNIWFNLAILVVNCAALVFNVYNGCKARSEAKATWDFFMKKRQECLDLAKQYRDWR